MGSGGSIQLARIFGIRIGVSPSWFLVLFVMIYLLEGFFAQAPGVTTTTSFTLAVVGAFAYFLSIVLHELGHALAAKRLGIGITGTGSRSRASSCGSSAAWRRCRATAPRRARSCRSRRPGRS